MRPRTGKGKKRPSQPDIPAPSGLRVSRLRLHDEELAVFTFPLALPLIPQGLSAAERAVVTGLLAGKSNADIAKARHTSVRTVANQVASLFRKLGVHSRAQLVAALSRNRYP
jgi:DNA-binding NarL/FixJ family response regulator